MAGGTLALFDTEGVIIIDLPITRHWSMSNLNANALDHISEYDIGVLFMHIFTGSEPIIVDKEPFIKSANRLRSLIELSDDRMRNF